MKALILSSGGIDSTTCLAVAIEKYGKDNVTALSFQYGQKHTKELEAAEKISNYYGVEQITLDLSSLFSYSDSTLLSHATDNLPKGSYQHQQNYAKGIPVSTYVPFRNGLFLSAAASIALSKYCNVIYYGAHKDDAAGSAYPDCSEAFHEAIGTAIYEGSGHQLTVEAPFISFNKSNIVKKGLELNTPYALTWSCYEGEESPCSTCGTCIDREKAFIENGIKDPMEENL